MATFGNNSTPNYSWWWIGINGSNQVASQYSVPAAASITSVNVYMAGHWAAVNAQAVLWDGGTGAVIRNSGTFSAGAGGGYQGGQSWHYTNVTAYSANQGDSVWIGFWRDPSGRAEWSQMSYGSFRVNGPVSGGAGSFAGNTNPGNPQGLIGAYCVYTGITGGGGGGGGGTTSRINLWNGTAWAQKPLNIWNGTAWVQKPLERWSGTAWG